MQINHINIKNNIQNTRSKLQNTNLRMQIQNSSMWKGVHLHRQCSGSDLGDPPKHSPLLSVFIRRQDTTISITNVQIQQYNNTNTNKDPMKHSPFYLCLSVWAQRDQWQMNKYIYTKTKKQKNTHTKTKILQYFPISLYVSAGV